MASIIRSIKRSGVEISRLALTLAFGFFTFGAPAFAQAWKPAQDEAIARFRAGDARAALAALQALLKEHPQELGLRADVIVVAQSLGDDTLALEQAKNVMPARFPSYALSPLGRSARTQGDFALSEAAYTELLNRLPGNVDAIVGRALALRGLGRLQAALDLVDALPRQNYAKTQRALLEVKALVSASFGKDLEVVRWALEMLALDPNDAAAQRYRFDALNRLGLVDQARDVTPTALLSREEQAQIVHDQLIAESRFVSVDESIQAYRFRIDPVIESLAALEADFSDTKTAQRARWDRITLLLDRQRFVEARVLLRQDETNRDALPAWFITVGAQALLAAREPTASVAWFKKAFAEGVNDAGARATLFYALLESEDTDQALSHVEALLKQVTQPTLGTVIDKSELLRLQILRARALLYTDQVAAGWTQIETLVAQAPANVEVNIVKAEAQSARGWRRDAMESSNWIRGQFPSNVAATVQLADGYMQRGDRVVSRAWLDEARATDPENRRALRSARDRAINDAGLLRMDYSLGSTAQEQSVGNASKERRAELSIYSPWFVDRFRLVGSAQQLRDARSPTDVIERNMGSVGLEWSSLDVSAGVQLQGDNQNRVGASARVAYEVTDQLRLSLSLGHDDRELPLRGWRDNVSVTHGNVVAQWRAHESQSFGVGLSDAHFSDGNNRSEFNGYWTQRWLTQAHFRFDTRLDAYIAHNRRSDVAYFSPSLRYGAALNATFDWVQWRFYEKNFTHRLSLTAGFDAQRDTASTGHYVARYDHAWIFGRCTELRYGVEWVQRGYDGKPENRFGASMSFEQRINF